MVDYLKWAKGKGGYIHTSLHEAKNLLELYQGADVVGEEEIELSPENKEKFYKLKVKDLYQAYILLGDTYRSMW